MEQLFATYILLNKELEKKGGRHAIPSNIELEELYERLLSIEDEIMKSFGFPKLMKYREIIFNLNSKKDFEIIGKLLKNAAEYYLTSSPEIEIELLEDAKMNDLKTYDVLPEIGIDDNLYAMFLFEEC